MCRTTNHLYMCELAMSLCLSITDTEGAGSSTTMSTMSDDSGEFLQPSILDALRAPRLSDLTYKCKVATNPPAAGKCRPRGESTNKPKGISVIQ